MSAKVYDARASLQSLGKSGWQAKETRGMPDTYAKVKQVGYLEANAADGQKIDLQFFENAASAEKELKAAEQHGMGMFSGTIIGNVMVFTHPMGETKVSKTDVDALANLLK